MRFWSILDNFGQFWLNQCWFSKCCHFIAIYFSQSCISRVIKMRLFSKIDKSWCFNHCMTLSRNIIHPFLTSEPYTKSAYFDQFIYLNCFKILFIPLVSNWWSQENVLSSAVSLLLKFSWKKSQLFLFYESTNHLCFRENRAELS